MEVMQEDYGGYGRRKKPGIGRYPMGPTNMTHSQMLGKFEYTGGPIFKVVLEC